MGTTSGRSSGKAVQNGAQDYLAKDDVNGKLLTRSVLYAIERRRAELALKKTGRTL